MLKTFLLQRPYAIFDAENADHRRAYFEYLKTSAWHNCPYQFVLEEPFTDLPANINHKMVSYYTAKEFKGKKQIKVKSSKK